MKLLFINACVRGEESRTLRLCRYYIERFLEAKEKTGEDWEIEEVNLNDLDIEIQKNDFLLRREELIRRGDFDDSVFDLAKQFMNCDFMLFGAPYWDLQFPAVLKIYLERCSVSGLTYLYNDIDPFPHSCCRAKHACYIMTAGGPTEGMNFGYDYVSGLLKNLFGFESCDLVKAEGIDIVGNDCEALLKEAMDSIVIR